MRLNLIFGKLFCAFFPIVGITCLFTPLQAQLSFQPEQDCFQAIPICQEVFTQVNSYAGAGLNPNEINPSLLSCSPPTGEQNGVWYTFSIETPGDLCFTLSPTSASDDYDWTLFNLTNSNCEAIFTQPNLEVACSRESPNISAGCNGNTGADGDTLAPCNSDNHMCIPVQSGQIYVLNVGFVRGADNGYTLDFRNSTASMVDVTDPEISAMSPGCGEVILSFTEHILCASVDPSDFTLDGPGGSYAITTVESENCEAGGSYDRSFRLAYSPNILQTGTYTLSIVGDITDPCGNSVRPNSISATLRSLPVALIQSEEGMCLNNNEFNFSYGGNSPGLVELDWDLGDGTPRSTRNFTHRYISEGTKTVTLMVEDDLGCRDTAQKNITVFPHPQIDFSLPGPACQGDSATFISTARIDTPYSIIGYEWSVGGLIQGRDSILNFVPTRPGNLPINLRVLGTNDCPSTLQKSYLAYSPPVVDFDITGGLCLNKPIQFTNKSVPQSLVGGGSVALNELEWDFGDGGRNTGDPAPLHTYTNLGSYPVTLIASTDIGCRDSLTQTIEIREIAPPQIFSDSACAGQTVEIEALPPDQSFSYWYSGANDSLPIFINDFLRIENIQRDSTFYVEAVSFDGCASSRLPVTAFAIQPANLDLSISDTTLVFPFTGVFMGVNGFATLTSIAWDFGDGNTSDQVNPFHVYNADGIFDLEVEITDEFGCTYVFNQQIEVSKPTTAFIPSAFSPNGDGENEEFFIRSQLLERFLIQIYDRYGNEIFRSFDPEFRWDGTYQGQPVNEGVYSFRFRAIDVTGLLIEDQGTITLIR